MPEPNHSRWKAWGHELVLAALLAALLGAAEYLVPGFCDGPSQLFLSRHLWEFALLGLGMTLIILTGGVDLSVGSIMGLCAVVFGLVFRATQRTDVASIACVLAGTLAGSLNGWLIARYRLHPLIVTLATFAAFRGVAEGVSQGEAYSQFGPAFSRLARGQWWGVPWPGYLFLLLAACCGWWLAMTPSGRFLRAIGYNETAARFAGIPVDRLRRRLYAFSGLLAGIATVVYVSRFDTAKADAGKGFELDVITAVVVGGTSIFGGRGNLLGTLLGLLLIHEVRLFVGRYWGHEELKPIVVGGLLVASILASRILERGTRERIRGER